MPNGAICWAMDHKLPHLEKWTLFLLSNYADQDGFGLIPIPYLVGHGGMTEPQAMRAIAKLEKKHILQILYMPQSFSEELSYRLDWRMD
jgi:hypothetical protein